ncbi:phosphatase PAP2 family protein [Candidatus Eisenbacteria bacterium]|uniref:Phosphatase PAP2 family protein n=1 Tax=Eiseniibacteriota bacterium TaxID=2212470 RepID=A0ABV6YJE8_UNCEI
MSRPHRGNPGIRLVGAFRVYDLLSIGFLMLVAILLLATRSRFADWYTHTICHLVLSTLIVATVMASQRFPNKILRFVRDVYPFALFGFLFDEMENFTHLIFPEWLNHLLIDADHFIFGAHPTVWLERLISPPLTEFLEVIYMSYYLLLPVTGVLLYLFANRKAFEGTLTIVSLAFYACFLGYILLPAEGPWTTLAHLQTVDMDASLARQAVAAIQQRGGIVGGCFPSAHVGVVFALLASLFLFYRKLFYPFTVYSILLAFATVYGRYHYAIDALAGMVVGLGAGIIMARNRAFSDSLNHE